MIRQTVGAVITSLLTAEEPGGWPEALEALTTGKGSQDMNVVEVGLSPPVESMLISVRLLHARKDHRGLPSQTRRDYPRCQPPRPPRARIHQIHRSLFGQDQKSQSVEFVLAGRGPRSSAHRQYRCLYPLSL